MAQHSNWPRPAIVLATIGICLAIMVSLWYIQARVLEQIVESTSPKTPNVTRKLVVTSPAVLPTPGNTYVPTSEITIEREISFKNLLTGSLASIAIALDGEMLVATDGYALGDGKSDLLFFHTSDLSSIKNVVVETDLPWSWGGVVLTSDKKRLLVCDREYDLTSLKETRRLVVNGVVRKGNIIPIPLAVSPNDKLAIIHIRSFLSGDMNVLGLWDLETGKIIRKLELKSPFRYPNARFFGNDRVVVWRYDGMIFIFDLQNNTSTQLRSKVATSPMLPLIAQNLSISRIGTTNLLVFSGRKSFYVIDIEKDEVVFSEELTAGNVQVLINGNLIYQGWKPSKGATKFDRGQPYFRIRSSTNWKIIRDINIDQQFEFFQVDQQGETIYAVKLYPDKIYKFDIPSNDDVQSDQ